MTQFDWLIFLHILGAFLICAGAGVGMSTGIAMSQMDSVRAIKLISIMSHRATMFVTLPGATLTLITGAWFVADYAWWELSDFWLASSFVLWVIAIGLDHIVLGPHLIRIHGLASQLETQGIESSSELRALANARRGPVTGNILTVIVLLFLILMVFQPGD